MPALSELQLDTVSFERIRTLVNGEDITNRPGLDDDPDVAFFFFFGAFFRWHISCENALCVDPYKAYDLK